MSATQQPRAPRPQPFGPEAFGPQTGTTIRWLGNASAMLNVRGTTLMIDPLLEGFDMPLLVQPPIATETVPHLDAVLLTHCDNDHFSRPTLTKLGKVCPAFHGPHYVAGLAAELGLPAAGHNIHESFTVGPAAITLTPADHAWQNESPKHHTRDFKMEDNCGFWIDTPDGTVWAVGDSRLLDWQLHRPTPDAILFDFSDSRWHITLDGAVKMAAAYPETPLILWHWGCVDAPNFKEFNGDPDALRAVIVNPARVVVLAPGQPWALHKLHT